MRAFSLLETLFSILILSILFLFLYNSYLVFAKNTSIVSLNQELFNLEKELLRQNYTHSINIILNDKTLHDLHLKESSVKSEHFILKSLKAFADDYKQEFKDEKSF
ncbi:MAG TPA: hypothetical protein K8V51_01690 [Campylobacter avium]|uniref:hypothetical protein n=1 Tax=Campylobacter avium TaxID=522485 RepID=UPI001DAAF6FA|nr:hypothetical protein [Campylobacter avium]HJE65759.1 hypothetical protein [Campylobacter avium]